MYILKYIRDGWNDLVFPSPSISIFMYVKCHKCTMYTSVFTVKLHKYKIFSSVSVVVKFLNTLNTHYRIVSYRIVSYRIVSYRIVTMPLQSYQSVAISSSHI